MSLPTPALDTASWNRLLRGDRPFMWEGLGWTGRRGERLREVGTAAVKDRAMRLLAAPMLAAKDDGVDIVGAVVLSTAPVTAAGGVSGA